MSQTKELGGALGAILQHRRGFDRWLAASKNADGEVVEPAAKRELAEATKEYDRSLFNILNYRPLSLHEASIIASHLIVHVELDHFSPNRLGDFLKALAIAPISGRGPRHVATEQDPALAAVAALRAAMADNDHLARVEKTAATEEERTVQTEELLQCGTRWMAELQAMVATVPATPAGLAAQAELLIHMETEWGNVGEIVTDANWLIFAKTVHLASIAFGRCQ